MSLVETTSENCRLIMPVLRSRMKESMVGGVTSDTNSKSVTFSWSALDILLASEKELAVMLRKDELASGLANRMTLKSAVRRPIRT